MKLFRTRALRRIDLKFDSARALMASPNAAEYFALANFRLTAVGDGRELLARVAQFPHASIVYYSGPEVEALWTRDAQSADRVLLVVGITTTVEIDGADDCVVVTREPRLALVAPGRGDVRFTVSQPGELLYLTVPSGMLADLPMPSATTHVGDPIDSSTLMPMVAFLVHLCRTSGEHSDDLAQLPSPVNEIVRTIAQLITRNAPRNAGLHARAMQIISRDFADRDLNAGRISDQLGAAPRTLQLAFQREGQTLAGQLRNVRALAAHQARAARPEASMASIAASVGFGSESAMFRALREFRDDAPRLNGLPSQE